MSKKSKGSSLQGIDNPIICSAYEEPSEHWARDRRTAAATKEQYRRPAGYWYRTEESKTGSSQGDLIAEDRQELPVVNKLRDDVRWWRGQGYPGTSRITKDLLRYWTDKERVRRLFFCQREAVETIIYLAEVRIPKGAQSVGGRKPSLSASDLEKLLSGDDSTSAPADKEYHQSLLDIPEDHTMPGLLRLGCKMATGSGKTLVMAMLIAWTLCNHRQGGSASVFPSAVLICCPNLTVKKRLSVLIPGEPGNYYDEFNLIPPRYRSLPRNRVMVTNWHALSDVSIHSTGGAEHKVVDLGEETSEDFARRVLGNLFAHLPIMVLNDEGHHCWRPKPNTRNQVSRSKEDQREYDEATVWIKGLDKINSQNDGKGIVFCVDMSATPFYIKSSGYIEGRPFPWLVSDFGLIDAIESGIVKIPRLPSPDTTKQPEPKYFTLWRHIRKSLGQDRGEDEASRGEMPPEKVYVEANAALKQLAGYWVQRFKLIQEGSNAQDKTPPVMIVVCNNTKIAEEFYSKISGERSEGNNIVYGQGDVFPEYFSNTEKHRYTIRIDSNALEEAGKDANEDLRNLVATVGKKGCPGEQVRCVVSVSMLTEGWDANNVTQILGVRAFESQLLCEQVVGRGLRRIDYEPNPETGLLTPEYVDVYGIPFSVIPYKGRASDSVPPEDKPKNHVRALEEREHMEMFFPMVDGYSFAFTKNIVRCDVDGMAELQIKPEEEPVITYVGPPISEGPVSGILLNTEKQDRQAYYDSTHINEIMFRLTHYIVKELDKHSNNSEQSKWGSISRHSLFPQVHAIVKKYVESKIEFNGANPCELGVAKYFEKARKRLLKAIMPDESKGETPLLPRLNQAHHIGSTSVVNIKTVRQCIETENSHINLVALDSGWEKTATETLESMASQGLIKHYARIYQQMGFVIPCGSFEDKDYSYMPDFLVCMLAPDGKEWTLILEIKGLERDKDKDKHAEARRWVAAVNNWRELGKWGFHVCYDPNKLAHELKEQHEKGPDTRPKQTA